MIDLDELQIIAQLTDNIDVISNKLEKSFNDNDSEGFTKSKKEIIAIKNKISGMIK